MKGPTKSFAMLFLSNFGEEEGAEVGGAEERGCGRLVTPNFPVSEALFWAAMEPKDLTPSAWFTGGADAGKEGIEVETSSIGLDVIADPKQEMISGRVENKR